MATNFLRYAGASANSGLLTTVLTLLNSAADTFSTLVNGATTTSTSSGSSGKFTNADTGQAQWGELFLTLGNMTAPVAGGNITGWFLTSPDSGTTYEATVSGTAQPRPPDFIIPLPASTITGPMTFKSGIVRIPSLQFKVFVQNNSGQTMSVTGSANLLKLATCADQY